MGKKPRTHKKRHFMTILKYFLVGLVMIIAYNSLTVGCNSSSQSQEKGLSQSNDLLSNMNVEDISTCPEVDCSDIEPEVIEVDKIVEKERIVEKKIYVCQNLRQVSNPDDCLVTDSEGWYEVKTLKGNSPTMVTELFTIRENTWRYTWKCSEKPMLDFGNDDTEWSLISLVFYAEGQNSDDIFESPKSSVFNNKCSDSDTNYVYNGKGTYFLKVHGANFGNWEVLIEAKK